jgi:hypothetical protein
VSFIVLAAWGRRLSTFIYPPGRRTEELRRTPPSVRYVYCNLQPCLIRAAWRIWIQWPAGHRRAIPHDHGPQVAPEPKVSTTSQQCCRRWKYPTTPTSTGFNAPMGLRATCLISRRWQRLGIISLALSAFFLWSFQHAQKKVPRVLPPAALQREYPLLWMHVHTFNGTGGGE